MSAVIVNSVINRWNESVIIAVSPYICSGNVYFPVFVLLSFIHIIKHILCMRLFLPQCKKYVISVGQKL